MKKKSAAKRGPREESPAREIDARIAELDDWRGAMLARVRKLIRQADPAVVEEVKWRKPSNSMLGVPVWSHDGILCTGETYKQAVKLTFAHGASLADPAGLFNASLAGNTRRAIDLHEGDKIDATAFQALIRAAVARNTGAADGSSGKKSASSAKEATIKKAPQPKLLSGGNPQIAKADGDSPVQAYIAAMPGWKRDVGRRLDELVVKHVPRVRKAEKWNSPFYGVEGNGWFLSFHCFTRYVKATFFHGASLKPLPPGGTDRSGDARWIDIHEGEVLDEAQLGKWIEQAAAMPGWLA